MKTYILLLLSIIVSFSYLSAMQMQLPPPLAHLNRTVTCLSRALEYDFKYCEQYTKDPQILEAKKSLYNATTSTLTAIKRLLYLPVDPITLRCAISGIVSIGISYEASPEHVVHSPNAQLLKLADGKTGVQDHTQHYIEHMLEILKPFHPILK